MKPVSLLTVARALGGTLAGADATTLTAGASVDSRSVRRGELFFALRGRLDGADFAPEAYLKGAVAAVATKSLSVPTVVVEDPLLALQELARWNLKRQGSPTVVGITGTVGKTTAKDALAAILRTAEKRVWATAGNFNNEIGLPLTVLSANEGTEFLVLEMGATHKGDIAHLCHIAPPEVGVLTAVSPVHLDSFGSLDSLAAAKGELALALPERKGILVSPVGVLESATGSGRTLARRISFGLDPRATLWATGISELENGLSFTLHVKEGLEEGSVEVKTPVFGTHLVQPLLAAAGGALALGLGLKACARGFQRLRRTGLRGEVYRLRDDIFVYDDSYNASPAAVAAVLRYGAEGAKTQGRRFVAVLGGMFELGAGAREYHREAGRLAGEVGVDLLVCVGDEARWYAEGYPGEAVFYQDAEEAAKALEGELRGGDYIVVKGSRGVGLDRLTQRLKERLALV
ncbi:MAG TPA: UDP-N-acetylmuramoyl-tripeptide--D-alanyl-D-alanine ligase [Rubrobacteraceae bacterium]|nr:UDP-N-acetylmuramoyl-tripeptide--D-alanyl-D-alanine ligase [Rubrobacteraceae bacterium]